MNNSYIFINPNSTKETDAILPKIIAASLIRQMELDKQFEEVSDRTA